MAKNTLFIWLVLLLTSFAPAETKEEAGIAPIVIKDTLPDGVPKGYVEFYYLKSEGNPAIPTDIYRIECNEELLEEELTSSWSLKDRVALRIAAPPGVYHFVIRKGTVNRRARVRVEEGMIAPVRIRFNTWIEGKSKEYEITSFTMDLTVEEPKPSGLGAGMLRRGEADLHSKAGTGSLTPAEEVAEALADLHAAMKVQDVEEIIAIHSDDYSKYQGADQSRLRSCYEGLVAQDILQNTTIDTEECKIVVEGDHATAGPVDYETPQMGKTSHQHWMKKEADGAWRIVYDEPIMTSSGKSGWNTARPGFSFEADGPMCAPMQIQTTLQRQGERISNSIGMEFVHVQPGKFKMGSPSNESGRDGDEKQHRVKLTQGFYMQMTEVTQGQWKAIMGNNPSSFKECGYSCPVENVSWNEVQDFIRKLNQREGRDRYRLPTETEWEYAARAGSRTRFSFGDDDGSPGEYAWYHGNSGNETHPVGQKRPNAWGIYDMHGNVLEWCQDWYDSYPSRSVTDPTGPPNGSLRVVRGGSWYDDSWDLRSANRGLEHPGNRFLNVGFRLLKTGE